MPLSRPLSASRALTAALAILVLTACASAASTASVQPSGPPLAVANAWVRPTTGGDEPTAAYLRIDNAGARDDQLLSASSPDASSVELMSTTMDSGMAGMQMRGAMTIPAGMSVALYPGGDHLMVMGVKHALSVGDTLLLQLVFEHAGEVDVQAQVREG